MWALCIGNVYAQTCLTPEQYGGIASDNKDDTNAIQLALTAASTQGGCVFLAPGTYETTAPLVLNWAVGFPKIWGMQGSGYATVLRASISESGRAALELLGESNTKSVKFTLSNFRIRMYGGSPGSYCLRVGDAKDAFVAEHMHFDGPNAVLLKVGSSASYAQINTTFRHSVFSANYNKEWYADETDATVYAVRAETAGAFWDNVLFESCTFYGVVQPRGWVVTIRDSQFSVSPSRPSFHSDAIFLSVGSLTVTDSYFEDYKNAIEGSDAVGPIGRIIVERNHFSGATNSSVKATRVVDIARSNVGYGIGFVLIQNNSIRRHQHAAFDPLRLRSIALFKVEYNIDMEAKNGRIVGAE